MACRALNGLLPAGARGSAARLIFDGTDLSGFAERSFRAIRGRGIGMVFQDPMSALNPYMRISAQMCEVLRLHRGLKGRAALDAAVAEIEAVGIPDASARIHQYPHQFSGGQRQRILIAISLLARPKLLIADEPTTALDVTIQAQILELLKARQRELGTAIIIITHNLGVAADICDDLLVMYSGMQMESGPAEDLLLRPAHPYTIALRAAVPTGEREELPGIPGNAPAAGMHIRGCPFASRCAKALAICAEIRPDIVSPSNGRRCACHLHSPAEAAR